MKKRVLWAALLICVIIAAGITIKTYFFPAHGGPGAGGHDMPPAEVSVITIMQETVTPTTDLPGRTSAFKVAEIRPQVSGIIVKRLFEEGSNVKEGEQLYQIDPAPYQAAYDSARADLQKAEANIKSVQAKAARYSKLVGIGGVSKQDSDDVNASLAQSNADVAIAKAALAATKINLDYTRVFSPISGHIGKSLVTEGALVTANQAQALATVQQFDKIYVDVSQSSGDLMQLRRQYAGNADPAQKLRAELLLENSATPYKEAGELQFSDVTVDQGTNTVQVRILFPNPNHEILPGLFVRARLAQAGNETAVLAPQKAVIRNADGSVIVMKVVEGNTIAPQPVKLGSAVGDRWIVTEGLQAGDKIVVEGIMKAAPGAIINPVEQGAPPAAMPPPETTTSPAPSPETKTQEK